MKELLEHYFNVLIQCVGAIYFGLGIVLLFGKVPLAAEYLPYRKAKRCLAVTYFIMGFNLVVYLAISSSADWKALNPYIKCTDFIFFIWKPSSSFPLSSICWTRSICRGEISERAGLSSCYL